MNEKNLTLLYVAHLTMLTGCLKEKFSTAADTLRQLVQELDDRYPGFAGMVIDSQGGGLRLNAAIYYNNPGQVPVSVINLDQPVQDRAKVTFW